MTEPLRRLGGFFAAHRYLTLSAVLVLGLSIQMLNEQWSRDVWAHIAVVRELATRTLHPRHPLLPIDEPFPFYSPYTLTLGLVGRVTGLGAVSILKVAGIVNAVLLFLSYRRFARVITGQRHAEFFGLLAILLLWGPSAWRMSGFLNLNSIGYGLPYPSTFATILMLVALTEMDLLVRENVRASRLIVLTLTVATILLTHPITGIATVAGLLAVWFGRGRLLPRRRDLPIAGALSASLLLVTIWPYYSFWRLLQLTGGNSDSQGHRQLYELVPLRLAPLIILVAFLLAARPNLRSDPLVVWASLGALLYGIGAATGNLTLGRALAFITLAMFTKVGAVVAAYLEQPRASARRERALAATAGVLAFLGLAFAAPALARMVPRVVLSQALGEHDLLAPMTARYRFLTRDVPQDAVVAAWPNALSDVEPALGGKVLATARGDFFVADGEKRRTEVRRFFKGKADQAERRRIIAREHVDFLLFDARSVRGTVGEDLAALGRVVYARDHLVLVATRR